MEGLPRLQHEQRAVGAGHVVGVAVHRRGVVHIDGERVPPRATWVRVGVRAGLGQG